MEPIPATFTAVLIASLIGSPHCAGMCGGFVAFCSGNPGSPVMPNVAYNFGRGVAYVILGVLAGLLGQSLDLAGELAGFQRVTVFITGILLCIWGVSALLMPGKFFKPSSASSGIYSWLSKLFKKVFKQDDDNWTKRGLLLGVLSAFMPCGWLYTFVAVAAATSSPTQGAVVMFAFWLGTVPVLATLSGITKLMTTGMRQYIPRLTGVLLLIAGVFALSTHGGIVKLHDHGAGHDGHHSHQHHMNH